MAKSKHIGRGGKRAKVGRPAGAATKKTREIADRAAAEGITPLEYMLKVMRNPKADVERRDDMAKAAARFVHPTLSAIAIAPPAPPLPGGQTSLLDAARKLAFVLRAGVMQLPREPRTLEHTSE